MMYTRKGRQLYMNEYYQHLESEMNNLLKKRGIKKYIEVVNNRTCLLLKSCDSETSEVIRRRMIDSNFSDMENKDNIREKARELMPLVVPEFNNNIYR